MALIDTKEIARQFGDEAAELVEKVAQTGKVGFRDALEVLKTQDLVITIRLQDRGQ